MKPYHAKSKSKNKPYSLIHWQKDMLNLAKLELKWGEAERLNLVQHIHNLEKQVVELQKQLQKRPCAL